MKKTKFIERQRNVFSDFINDNIDDDVFLNKLSENEIQFITYNPDESVMYRFGISNILYTLNEIKTDLKTHTRKENKTQLLELMHVAAKENNVIIEI